jgi:hypothetical protein
VNPGRTSPAVAGTETAQHIARVLEDIALKWGRLMAACMTQFNSAPVRGNGASEYMAALTSELRDEVLAYALSCIEFRLQSSSTFDQEWLKCLRQECHSMKTARAWKYQQRHKSLPVTSAAWDALAATVQTGSESAPAAAQQLTAEQFELFCRNTGLSSGALVGDGENLAALLFYLALYCACSAHGTLNRAQIFHLLKSARTCRGHLNECIHQWLGAPATALLQMG